jgi:hypothetical protein
MNQEKEILDNIVGSIDAYAKAPLSDYLTLSEILRTLTANLFYLEAYRVQANQKWHSIYFNSEAETNAGKEREADLKVEELYKYRRLMTAGYRICDALRSQISISKKENN